MGTVEKKLTSLGEVYVVLSRMPPAAKRNGPAARSRSFSGQGNHKLA
jgi:hypothetical protein